MFLLHDNVKGKTYRYALVVVDIAARYKDAEILTFKDSKEVAKSFKIFCSRNLH